MSRIRKGIRGFTLIEILIVVVIIAILAALIIPRFLNQPERAVVAEANQMLGAIGRAQNTYVDSGAGAAWVALDATAATWNKIGMQLPATTNFTYTCSTTVCTAARAAGSGNYATDQITITYVAGGSPTWLCTGGSGTNKYSANTTGGCTT